MGAADLELRGVSLFGPPPVGEVHIPLLRGVAALYGRNGAGKTRVIAGIRAAIRGYAQREGVALLHVRLPDPEASLATFTPTSPSHRLGLHLVNELQSWRRDALYIDVADAMKYDYQAQFLDDRAEWFLEQEDWSLRTLVAELLKLAANEADPDWGESDYARLVNEVAPEGTLTLEAIGTAAPRWRVWVSATPSEDAPTLSRAYSQTRAYWESMLAVKEAGTVDEDGNVQVTSEAWNELMGRSLPPTPFRPIEAEARHDHLMEPPPPWIPLRLLIAGEIESSSWPTPIVVNDVQGRSADVATLEAITDRLGRDGGSRTLIKAVDDDDAIFAEDIEALLTAASHRASDLASRILLDAPVLRCSLVHPNSWLSQAPVQWRAYDSPSMSWVALEELSDAQRRWAEVAVAIALAEHEHAERELVLLLDEPERALHPAAGQHMVAGLLTASSEHVTVAATHSAQVLNQPGVHLHHVERDARGRTSVVSLAEGAIMRLAPERLGLTPADLLQHYRVFLAVEGEHDRAVVRGLIGDELEACRTTVVVLRGVKSLRHVVDLQLLFAYTDAALLVAVDRTRVNRIDSAWVRAKSIASQGRRKAAIGELMVGGDLSSEERLLLEFCRRAVEAGRTDRVDVFGFEKADVLQYLPVAEFVANAGSWEQLVDEWRASGGGPSFKHWLRGHGATVSVKSAERAVKAMDSVPSEFMALLQRCRSLARLSGRSQD